MWLEPFPTWACSHLGLFPLDFHVGSCAPRRIWQVQALEPFPERAGAAAGVMGSMRMAFVSAVRPCIPEPYQNQPLGAHLICCGAPARSLAPSPYARAHPRKWTQFVQVATLLGFVHDGTPLPMAIMTACVCAVAVVVHFALVSCEARAQQEVLKYADFDTRQIGELSG